MFVRLRVPSSVVLTGEATRKALDPPFSEQARGLSFLLLKYRNVA